MFNSSTFDVTIGLIFVFLLYSLLATILNEFIATLFSYRSRMLERGLEQMLDGKNFSYYWWDKIFNFFIWIFYFLFPKNNLRVTREAFLEKSKVISLNRVTLNKKAALFASEITNHPLYKRSSQNSLLSKKPAYLPAPVFTNILIDILRPDSLGPTDLTDIALNILKNPSINYDLKSILNIYIQQANGDMQRFRSIIEDWYNDTMARVSGWYKRQANRILFFLGLLLAISFNVSTIRIVETLSKNPKIRDALANQASVYLKDHISADIGDTAQDSKILFSEAQKNLLKIQNLYSKEIDSANNVMGAGWSTLWADNHIPIGPNHYAAKAWCVLRKGVFNFSNLIGFIITALAICLGAPFWFDLLNKFVNLRAAGAKPNDPKNLSGDRSNVVDLSPSPDGIRVVERNG